MKTVKQILIDARALITLPEHWTRDAYARDAKGNSVAAKSSEAVCWCTVGAVCKVETNTIGVVDAIGALCNPSRPNISYFNDTHTHAEVLEMFDAAILAL